MIADKKRLSTKKNKVNLFLWLFLAGLLAFMVQKEVSLPSWVILGGAMLAFMALLVKSLKSPMPAMLVMICYIPFSKILVGDFGGSIKALNFTNILMIFVIIGMLSQKALTGKKLFEKNSLNIPILLFCVVTCVSFIRGSFYFGHYWDFIKFLSEIKRWLTPPLIFFLAFNAVRDKESFKAIVKIMMVVVVLVGLMACWDYMNIGHVSNLDKARIGGISDQPNQLAGFFVYYMFIYAGFFLVRFPAFNAWMFLVPFLITFRGIMVTFSRGGYLAFAMGALAISFFRSKILFITVVLCMGFAIMNPQFLPGGIKYRMGQTVTYHGDMYGATLEDSLEKSSSIRIKIWKAGIKMIKANPLMGFGYGTFPHVVGFYDGEVAGRDAHNSFIIMAAEMGIPAMLVFLWIIWIIFWDTRWVYKNEEDIFVKSTALGMLGGIFGLLAVNMFGSRLGTLEISGYFWILAGIILRMKKIELEKRIKQRKAERDVVKPEV